MDLIWSFDVAGIIIFNADMLAYGDTKVIFTNSSKLN